MQPPSRPNVVTLAVLFYVPMVFLALAWNWWFGLGSIFRRALDATALLQLLAGLGSGLAIVLLSIVLGPHVRWMRELEGEFRRAVGRLTRRDVLVLALASSIGEEALFRGALQPKLGLLATSALFGGIHLPLKRELWPWPLLAFVLGLLLGALYEWMPRNIYAPISCHFTINWLNLGRIVSGVQPEDSATATIGRDS